MLGEQAAKDTKKEMFLPGTSLSAQLQCLLNSSHRKLDLVAASEIMGVSMRTLRCRLKAEGFSYSGEVDQWRFKKGVKIFEKYSTFN